MKSKMLDGAGLAHFISGREFTLHYKEKETDTEAFYRAMVDGLGREPRSLYIPEQIHGNTIAYCDGENGLDFFLGKYIKKTDALITNRPGVALLIKFADCTPIVLYDPVKWVCTIIHGGWRGTALQITKKAVQRMVADFNTNPRDILAYIGPTIDQDSYEVGEDVFTVFEHFENRDELFYPKGKKYHLSLIKAHTSMLLDSGIPSEQIEVAAVSTYLSQAFYSYRRDAPDYGLNAMVIMMK